MSTSGADRPTLQRQAGAIGLVLMVMIGLLIGLVVFGYARTVRSNRMIDPLTILALSQAREALLGYAITYRDTHPGEGFGYFPCPDMGSGIEGQAATACGGTDVTVIGRLPWKTLDLAPLRDASGECLWYAISGNYKNNPKTDDLINPDTNGLIEVMAADAAGFIAGATPTQRAVAVVFAPGAILGGQGRTLAATNSPTICGGNYDPANYLDTDIASGINNAIANIGPYKLTRFIAATHSDLTGAGSDAFNDQLMTISPLDVWERHLQRRSDFETHLTDPLVGLLRKTADCLNEYADNAFGGAGSQHLPWAAPIDVGTFKFGGDGTQYSDTANLLSGRLPRSVPLSAFVTGNNIYALDALDCSGWSDEDKVLWDKWQDHLFYAVARAHRPDEDKFSPGSPCDEECIDVEDSQGIKTDMAAVVIFSGNRLTDRNQVRNNIADPAYQSTDKANPSNYLEGINHDTILRNPTSDPGWNRLFSKIAGNDTIMCLRFRPGKGLIVDPTCRASGRCTTDGTALAGYRAGAANNCRVGASGIAAACVEKARNIDINNCPGNFNNTYSCERAARDFLSNECLQGFGTSKCQLAHTALTKCQ
jgi:hypothetical protein